MDVPAIELLLQDICQGMSLKRTPELRVWETPGTCLAPVTVGVLRPVIVLSPAMFHGLAPNRLREALVHECAHVLRRDPLIGLLQRIAVIGFWPHPLVWVLDRALARAREEVCDNYVLRNSDSTSYAETLFEVSQRAQSSMVASAQLGLFLPSWRLEERIAGLLDTNRVLLTQIRPIRAMVLSAVLLVAVAVSGGVRFLAADTTVDASPEEEGIAETTNAEAAPDGTAPAQGEEKLLQDMGLRGVPALEDGRVKTVGLQQGRLTPEVVQKLKSLSALNGISLSDSTATDQDLGLLTELPGIEALWLSAKQITPTTVVHLAKLPKLTRVHVSGQELTDSGLMLLASVPQLKFVGLSGTQVTEAGLANLKQFESLTGFMIHRGFTGQDRPDRVTITDAGLEILGNLPSLTTITLGRG
jgi:hypothetical protein